MEENGSHNILHRMTAYLYVENNQDSRNSLVMDVIRCRHPSLSGPRKTSESVSHGMSGCAMSLQATLISQHYNLASKYSGNDRGAADIIQLYPCQRTYLHIIIIIIIISSSSSSSSSSIFPRIMPFFFDCLATEDGADTGCPEKSVIKYQPMPCNIPKDRRPQLRHGGSLRSRKSGAIWTEH
jgi:hypothetical protein